MARWNNASVQTRIVTFWACLASQGANCSGTTNYVDVATVAFDDYSSAGIDQCSASQGTATCGTGEAIESSVIRNATGGGGVTGAASQAGCSPRPRSLERRRRAPTWGRSRSKKKTPTATPTTTAETGQLDVEFERHCGVLAHPERRLGRLGEHPGAARRR